MRILVSNDDGYQSTGIDVLAKTLAQTFSIDVVAPDRDRSGASNSLTLDRPLRCTRQQNGMMSVNGTPTDCVHIAITGLLVAEPDMVVSGINAGANLGDDVLYSGTVAAAMEGRFLGYPAIAVSLAAYQAGHYETAALFVHRLVQRLKDDPLPRDTILNVNVPDLPWEDIAGVQATRLGNRHKSEPVIMDRDPRGQRCYWVGPAGPEQDAGPGTDFYAISQGYISVTPVKIDLTRHELLPGLQDWLDDAK